MNGVLTKNIQPLVDSNGVPFCNILCECFAVPHRCTLGGRTGLYCEPELVAIARKAHDDAPT